MMITLFKSFMRLPDASLINDARLLQSEKKTFSSRRIDVSIALYVKLEALLVSSQENAFMNFSQNQIRFALRAACACGRKEKVTHVLPV